MCGSSDMSRNNSCTEEGKTEKEKKMGSRGAIIFSLLAKRVKNRPFLSSTSPFPHHASMPGMNKTEMNIGLRELMSAKNDNWSWMFPLLGISAFVCFGTDFAYAEELGSNSSNVSKTPFQNTPQDPSIVGETKSNTHTAKWRIYTDTGRRFASQGKFSEAEKYFYRALEEAKKGFGEDDPHVASACNNLAELFRVRKDFSRAEPFYLEAIQRLEQSLGPNHESIGFALHNLAGFYLLQRKLDQAHDYYERALKVKGRVLGPGHPDYANTMFHLGEVTRLEGNLMDAVPLIQGSLQILEDIGLGETPIAVRRMSILAEILKQSKQINKAEILQRKVIHVLELSEDSSSMNLASALEALAQTLQEQKRFEECEEILQRCLDLKKKIFDANHMQLGAGFFKLGFVALQYGDELSKLDKIQAHAQYDKAQNSLGQAIRIAEENWKRFSTKNLPSDPSSHENQLEHHLLSLVVSLNTLGLLGLHILDLNAEIKPSKHIVGFTEGALRRCLSLLKEENALILLARSKEVEREHIKCARYLVDLLERKGRSDKDSEEIRHLKDIIQNKGTQSLSFPK